MDFEKYSSALNVFSISFMKLMKTSNYFTEKGFSPLNISTMTVVCQTNTSFIDMEKFVNNFDDNIDFDAELKKKHRYDTPVVTKRGKVKKNFFNQGTLTFRDITTKSIKIFTNGKLQMTGITSLLEGQRVAHKVCDLISRCTETNVIPVSVDIAMINSDFCIRKSVNILRLMTKITGDVIFSYDPDTYPGLKMKYNNVSIFVFSTGSVVITGSKSLQDLHSAFTYITNLVFSNAETCTWGETKEKKRKMKYKHGYPKNIIDCCAVKFSVE
tara:strand:- start:7360 stop:8169 length:810 start_codon:yes stop_codon:yes gene_type:complete